MAIPENTMFYVIEENEVIVSRPKTADGHHRIVASAGYRVLSFKSIVTVEKDGDPLEVFYLRTVIDTVAFIVEHYEGDNEGLAGLAEYAGVAKFLLDQETEWLCENADKAIELQHRFIDELQGHGLFGYHNDETWLVYGNMNPNVAEEDHDGYVISDEANSYSISTPDGRDRAWMPNMLAAVSWIEKDMEESGYYPDIYYSPGDEYFLVIPSVNDEPCDKWLSIP